MRLAPWNRIWFTIGALLVYQLGTHIPLPGIDPSAVEQVFRAQGGVLSAGTLFLVWLSNQITARGIGNGLALIMVAGIVAELPTAVAGTVELHRQGVLSTGQVVVLPVLAVAMIGFIVFMERARRQLPMQYFERQDSGRQIGSRMLAGRCSHLPLKLNIAGVIPVIFASWLLGILAAVANFVLGSESEWLRLISAQLGPGRPLFLVLNFGLILLLTFFYAAFVFNPTEAADNLKKHDGFIPSIEPGERTAEHIDTGLCRLAMIGAAYLALVCLIPEILVSYANVPLYFGGMSLLIMACTIIDIDAQIRREARLKLGGYQR